MYKSTPSAAELFQRARGLVMEGSRREALPLLRKLGTSVREPHLLNNIGTVFAACEAHAEATRCFEAAVASDPSSSTYLYNLATSLRALGRLENAEQCCDRALALNPNDCEAARLRSDLRKQAPDRNHLPDLQGLLARVSGEDRVLVCFALAKEYEDLGLHDQSFAILSEGAHIYRALIRYDVAGDIEVIDRVIASHTADALKALRGFPDSAPIFIVGLPRSGTTLLERMLQCHSELEGVGERMDFVVELMNLIRASPGEGKTSRSALVARSLTIDLPTLGTRYAKRVQAEDPRLRTIDKMPINYLYCGLIRAALPNAKIISVRRDPLDSCYAAYKAYLKGPYGFTYDLNELGRYFRAYARLARHWRDTLPTQCYAEVFYEDLVRQPEVELRRLADFLGLPWESRMLDFHRSSTSSSTASAAQVRQPVYTSSIGRWRKYRHHLHDLEILLADESERYDRDRRKTAAEPENTF